MMKTFFKFLQRGPAAAVEEKLPCETLGESIAPYIPKVAKARADYKESVRQIKRCMKIAKKNGVYVRVNDEIYYVYVSSYDGSLDVKRIEIEQ